MSESMDNMNLTDDTMPDIQSLVTKFKNMVIGNNVSSPDNKYTQAIDQIASDNEIDHTTNNLPEQLKGIKTRDIKYPISIDEAYKNELKVREQQDMVFSVVNNPKIPDSEKHKIYTSIINKSEPCNTDYISYITEQIYPGPIDLQGIFVNCPSNMHKHSHFDNKYIIIFDNESHNANLMERINNTEVTIGMLKHTQGEKWLNGLIAYNDNSIIVRDDDNNFGMPGFMQIVNFYNRLGVKIMKDYIVPHLIRCINCGMIDTHKGSEYVRSVIRDIYSRVFNEKMTIINDVKEIMCELTENQLFHDLPPKATLVVNSNKDDRLCQIERKVLELTDTLTRALDKIAYLEEICLDMSINHHKSFDENIREEQHNEYNYDNENDIPDLIPESDFIH